MTAHNSDMAFAWIYDLYRLVLSGAPMDSPREVYTLILNNVVRELQGHSGSLALRDEPGEDFVLVALKGVPMQFLGNHITPGEGVLGWVSSNGEAMLLHGELHNDGRFGPLAGRADSGVPGSALCWPLKVEGRVIGAVCVNRGPGVAAFEPADLERGGVMLNLVSVALENVKLHLDRSLRIAELTQANQRLEETQGYLLQSEKMASIGQLAAGVAHEINNPVGYVSSNLTTLQKYILDLFHLIESYEQSETDLPEPTRQTIQAIKGRIDFSYLRDDVFDLMNESLSGLWRVKQIVQDLKDFSHVDEGEWQWVDLRKGLESTLNIVWNELKYKVELVKELESIPEVECQASQINQVFMNMLVNAGHAINEHGTITLRCGQADEEVWVEIQDSGAGIAPEHLKRIFDPFFTTKPVGKGTGLGLSLSYSIIQKHHGRIEVSSQLGVGTRFRITLPIRQTKAAPEPVPESTNADAARA